MAIVVFRGGMSERQKFSECQNNAYMLINPKYILTLIMLIGWIPIINIGREVRLFDILIAACVILYFNNFKKIFTNFFIFIVFILLLQAIYASLEWTVGVIYYIRFFELVVLVRLLSMLSVASLNAIMVRFFWTLFLIYIGINHFGLDMPFLPDTQAIVQSLLILSFSLYLLSAKTMLANKNTILLVSFFFIIDWTVKSYLIVGIVFYIGMVVKDYGYSDSLKSINLKKFILYFFIFIGITVLYSSFNIHNKVMKRLYGSIPVAMVIYDVAESQSELSSNPLKSGDVVEMRDFTGSDYIDRSFALKSARYVLMIQQLLRFPDNITGIGLGGSNLRSPESFVLVLTTELGILLSLFLVLKYYSKQYYFFIVILMFGLFSSLWYTEVTLVLCTLWVVNNINYRVKKIKKYQNGFTQPYSKTYREK